MLAERRRTLNGPFDQQPVRGCTLDELDLHRFRSEVLPTLIDAETLAANGRAPAEQLAAVGLADADGTPNVAGVLVAHPQPTRWLPGAYVQFVRFDGDGVTDPVIDQQEVRSTLGDVIARLDDLVRANVSVAAQIAGTDREVRRPAYPRDALQQLLRNAIMHREYEVSHAPVQWYWFRDRIEIHNPGGLFGRARPETFGELGGNDYRNPNIAAVMKAMGYVQRFGMGVPLSRKACADNSNPPPGFVVNQPSRFLVTLQAVA